MQEEFAKRWVADLRNPNNKQCTSVLHDGIGYCCLGRAVVLGGFALMPRKVDVDGDGDIEEREDEFVIDGTQDDEGIGGEYETLENRTMEILGFIGPQGEPKDGSLTIDGRNFESLAAANDAGITFAQIADWVEKNWERL